MTALLLDSDPFALPARIRNRLVPDEGFQARFELADRLAGLPLAETVANGNGALPGTSCVYLRMDNPATHRRLPALLFCRIDCTGISVEGLSDSERHRVLCRGWGKLESRRVKLFMPRDDEELDVCWSILYRAYCSIINSPHASATMPRAIFDDLPEVSRTCLI